MFDLGLICPSCGAGLTVGDTAFMCTSCGWSYAVIDGIPVLVSDAEGDHAAAQARWFDEEVDAEWEINRPHGSPRFHRWLLGEKFRRSVTGLPLHDLTALTVCGGSGMDAEFLARAGARVIATDISLGAARRTRERARRYGVKITPMVADVERLPFPDRSIDVVYVHDGLHHIERPLDGLAEMARVARRFVCVTEPARAAVTDMAVRVGLALEQEEAGNRVARFTVDDVRATLEARGLQVVSATRYGMYYRHEPGRAVWALSHQPLLSLAQFSFRFANALAGRFGNKLAVQAVREPT